MASPTASRTAAAQPLLPDEILEDIFLLLESGADLARASATCRSFRRVATGRRFLRRFSSLHPPPLVGVVSYGLHPIDPTDQAAPAARAIAQAGDFTFSFIPNPSCNWTVQDVRDGRVLLSRPGVVDTDPLELMVCDPLYRRYVQITLIPGDLVSRMPSRNEMQSEPFLAPAGDEEEDQHFRVIYNFVSTYKIVSLVFSVATGKWRGGTSFSFLPARLIERPKRLARYYARSCFYWVAEVEKYMLMLDPREMKFSLVELLLLRERNRLMRDISYSLRGLAVMDAAEGRLGLIALGTCKLDIYSRTCQNNGVGAVEWRHDKCIPLPLDYNYSINGAAAAADGHLLLHGAALCGVLVQKVQLAVNLKTLQVARLCELNDTFFDALPYASFPPPLSLPRL